MIHDSVSRSKDAVCELIEAERGTPAGIGRFLRDRFEEDLLRDWHLPECQKFQPVPPALRDSFLLRSSGGFSCNCDLSVWLYRQYQAKLALLERCEREIQRGPGALVAGEMLALLARAYGTHPQFNPHWHTP